MQRKRGNTFVLKIKKTKKQTNNVFLVRNWNANIRNNEENAAGLYVQE